MYGNKFDNLKIKFNYIRNQFRWERKMFLFSLK